MTHWEDILAAVGVALGGDAVRGRSHLRVCWAGTTETDHAQRCVLAHYLADLEGDLDAEVAWDERALTAFTHVRATDLAPVGIPAAARLAPSLHLNLGDGYLRQGRTARARAQLTAGIAALDALPDDGYGAMIRAGLTGLRERLTRTDSTPALPTPMTSVPLRSPIADTRASGAPHREERASMATSVRPVLVADLLAEGERMPVYVHVIDHPDARVLVDTGMTELHPAVADMDPRLVPLSTQADFDLASIDIVINTHLHFDHCGGNHLFAGSPVYVQRQELDDARSEEDYTIREWVEAPGAQYVPVDGALELLPGVRLVPAPGHTRGSQVVVVETAGRPVVIGGDMAVFFRELDEPRTEGQQLVRALDPAEVWLAHEHDPWRPQADQNSLNRASEADGR